MARNRVSLNLSDWQLNWFIENLESAIKSQQDRWKMSIGEGAGKMRASEFAMASVELQEILDQAKGEPSLRQKADAARQVADDERSASKGS
jgi:hypothetical protein